MLGRWNVSIFHTTRLNDEITLSRSARPIDLLASGGLDGQSEAEHSIEYEGGVAYAGIGLRLNGDWIGERTLRTSSGAVTFDDRFTANLRAFVGFDALIMLWPDMAPIFRGSRITLAVNNLTDAEFGARDATGATPFAFQDGFLAPQGRAVQLSFRKQF